MEQKPEEPKKEKKHAPIWKNSEFMLSQILMVMATVVGIYVAAEEGFSKAIEFDYLKGDIDGWHVRTAMRSELVHNLDGLHNLIGHVRKNGKFPDTKAEWPILSRNAWDGAKYHSAYFETSPAVLAAMGAFYDEVPQLLEDVQNNRVMPKIFLGRIKAHMKHLEGKSLPTMETNLAAARARLDAYGAPVPDMAPPAGWSHPIPIDKP